MSNANNPKTRITTDKVRVSYAHLTAPAPINGSDEKKYSCQLLIPKTDLKTKARIDGAIQAALQKGRETGKFDAKIPLDRLPTPIYDGDGVKADGYTPFPPECAGCWVISASCREEDKPDLVDANMNKILDPGEIYSGMYARVSLNFYPYAQPQRKGIGCGLGNVQKVADGEPLGGSRATAEDDFDVYDPLS